MPVRDSHRAGPRAELGLSAKPRRLMRRPFLFLVFQAAHPLEGGARFCLTGIDEVAMGSGERLEVERLHDGTLHRLTIIAPSRWMSRKHARLRRTPTGWAVDDLESKSGVYRNGQRIRDTAMLYPGDLLTLGSSFFRLETLDTDDGTDATADRPPALPGMATLLPTYAAQLDNLRSIAVTRAPIALIGETGVGKELLARAIHELSRRTGPYQAINCAAIARTLLESELFGYVKGAFSGATRNHPGHFEAARGGTLLLDEILAAPAEMQAALLRVLQEGQVTPVGARAPRTIDVRFVAASQRPLEDAVAHDRFRADLRARLEGFVLKIPPLRERTVDIGLFVAHTLRELGATPADTPGFTMQAAMRILRHRFPGNVRELATAVGRARTLARGGLIDEEHLLLDGPGGARGDNSAGDLEELRHTLVDNLRLTHGDVAETARRIGRNRTLVYRWLARFGIDVRRYRD